MLRFFNIFIDVSNLFHISYANASRDLGIGEPSDKHPFSIPEKLCTPDQIVELNKVTCYEFFKKVTKLNNEFRAKKGTTYFLFDSRDDELDKRQGARKIINDNYKKGRTRRSDNFYQLLKYIGFIAQNLDESFKLVMRPSFEADDLVKPLLDFETLTGENISTLLVSNDLDWTRSVDNESIHIYNDHKVKDLTAVSKQLGLEPSFNRIVMYKMVFGDESDGIPKPETLKGHKKDLLAFINTLDSPRTLLYLGKSTVKDTNAKLREALLLPETKQALEDNFALIDYLDFDGNVEDYITSGQFNPQILERYFRLLSLDPDKISHNLKSKLNWDRTPTFTFGGFCD